MAVMHVTKSISTEVGAICAHALILRSLQRQLRFVNEYNEYWQYLRLLTQPNDNKCLSRWAQHMNRPIKHKSFLRTMENYVCVAGRLNERTGRSMHLCFVFWHYSTYVYAKYMLVSAKRWSGWQTPLKCTTSHPVLLMSMAHMQNESQKTRNWKAKQQIPNELWLNERTGRTDRGNDLFTQMTLHVNIHSLWCFFSHKDRPC